MTEDLNTSATKSQVFKSSGAKFPDNIGRMLKDIHYPIRPARIRESWMSFGVPEIASKAPRDSGSVWRPCLATRPVRRARSASPRVRCTAMLLVAYPSGALLCLSSMGRSILGEWEWLRWSPAAASPKQTVPFHSKGFGILPARVLRHWHRSRLYLHLSHSKSFLSPWRRR